MANLRDPIAEAKRQWIAHGWGPAASGMTAVTAITRVQQILAGRVESALTPLGLTFARFEILRLLGFTRTGQLPMGKISDRLQVHPASVTSAVKRLERDGLIQRNSDETDSRIVVADITTRGRELLAIATTTINRVFLSIGVQDSDLDEMVRLLNLVRVAAGDPVDCCDSLATVSGATTLLDPLS